jgi:hypothetical protein
MSSRMFWILNTFACVWDLSTFKNKSKILKDQSKDQSKTNNSSRHESFWHFVSKLAPCHPQGDCAPHNCQTTSQKWHFAGQVSHHPSNCHACTCHMDMSHGVRQHFFCVILTLLFFILHSKIHRWQHRFPRHLFQYGYYC